MMAMLGVVPPGAHAAPDEIQVYTEEMDDPGAFGLELHVNYVPDGKREPSYPGEMLSNHRLQVTPEFSYGVTKSLEAGLYLPVAMSGDGELYANGLRLRLKYIAPRAEDAHFFWGMNVELGYSSHRVSESAMALELRPIIGYRDERWLLSFNPILDTDLSTNVSRKSNFEPALKVTHSVIPGIRAGFEYYGEYGPIDRLLPAPGLTHTLYGVMDVDLNGLDVNFGIGHGLQNAEDQWIAKAIIAFPFK
ncbi:hypothetical protein [Thiobacillus sedimenti]|uniref:Transporter n=1 Tax=Thiobacillus sedimenti TaxID=3110231 RepID=A0ABZ1CF93_9PROT|nr:hypothetical protein [Thiobacillus sp. SCUT-2]WRS38042.1 hypothetical protein VA613_08425 [Thiobacillus sp. SCUT-2]